MYSATASPKGWIVGGGRGSVLLIWDAEHARAIHTLRPLTADDTA